MALGIPEQVQPLGFVEALGITPSCHHSLLSQLLVKKLLPQCLLQILSSVFTFTPADTASLPPQYFPPLPQCQGPPGTSPLLFPALHISAEVSQDVRKGLAQNFSVHRDRDNTTQTAGVEKIWKIGNIWVARFWVTHMWHLTPHFHLLSFPPKNQED